MTQPQDPQRSWPRFQTRKPRILLLTSQFFLLGEIRAACERLGVEHVLLDLQAKEMGLDDFVRTILGALTTFRPDFVLTVNHLGVDREGVLLQILEALDLPLASWFVDNPHLILPAYPRTHADKTMLFTWDADNIEPLRDMGYPNTEWLPLGTDVHRFAPGASGRPDWDADVSFVGNSMVAKVLGRYKAAAPRRRTGRQDPGDRGRLRSLGRAFGRAVHAQPLPGTARRLFGAGKPGPDAGLRNPADLAVHPGLPAGLREAAPALPSHDRGRQGLEGSARGRGKLAPCTPKFRITTSCPASTRAPRSTSTAPASR